MSRTLKWVLGILAVLVVIAIVAGGVWFWQNRAAMMASYRPSASQPNAQAAPGAPNGQNLPFGPRGYNNNGNRPMYGWNFRGPTMMGRGRHFGFGLFGAGFILRGLLRLVIPLGLLALVAFVFYQLGRRAGPAAVPAPRRDNPPSDSPTSIQNPPAGS